MNNTNDQHSFGDLLSRPQQSSMTLNHTNVFTLLRRISDFAVCLTSDPQLIQINELNLNIESE